MAHVAAGKAASASLLSCCHTAYPLLLALSASTALSEREREEKERLQIHQECLLCEGCSLLSGNSEPSQVFCGLKFPFARHGKVGFLEAMAGLRHQLAH